MKTTVKKEFDCVKSVRKQRDRIASETEGMNTDEILAYFKKRREKASKKAKGNQ